MQISTSCYAPGAEAVLQYITHGVARGVDLLQLNIWMGAHLSYNVHKPVSASWALPRRGRSDFMQATIVPLCKSFNAAVQKCLMDQPFPCPGNLLWQGAVQNPESRAVWLRNQTIYAFGKHCEKLFGVNYPRIPMHGSLEVGNIDEVCERYRIRQ